MRISLYIMAALLCLGMVAASTVPGTLNVGQSGSYMVDGAEYVITLAYASTNNPVLAKFVVNSDIADAAQVGSTVQFPSGDLAIQSINADGTVSFSFTPKFSATCSPKSDITATLKEGETRTYNIKGTEYSLTNVYVSSSGIPEVKVTVNGYALPAQRVCDQANVNVAGHEIALTPITIAQGQDSPVTLVITDLTATTTESTTQSNSDSTTTTQSNTGSTGSETQSCTFKGDVNDVLKEGETKTITINGQQYKLTAVFISGGTTPEVKFSVNDYALPAQKVCDQAVVTSYGHDLTLTPTSIDGTETTGSVSFAAKETSASPGKGSKSASCTATGDLSAQIKEGDTKDFNLSGQEYEITLLFASFDSEGEPLAKFSVNGAILPASKVCSQHVITRNGLDITLIPTKIEATEATGTVDFVLRKGNANTVVEETKSSSTQTSSTPASTGNSSGNGTQPTVNQTSNSSTSTPTTPVIVDTCPSGCKLDGKCVPVGTRIANGEATYCSFQGTFQTQVPDNATCQNSYECTSNQCLNAVCTSLEKEVRASQSLLEKIAGWFKHIFG